MPIRRISRPEFLAKLPNTAARHEVPRDRRSRRPGERPHLRPPPLQDNIQAEACGLYRVLSVNTRAYGLDEKTGMAAVSEVDPTTRAVLRVSDAEGGVIVRRSRVSGNGKPPVLFGGLDVGDGTVEGWVFDTSARGTSFGSFLTPVVLRCRSTENPSFPRSAPVARSCSPSGTMSADGGAGDGARCEGRCGCERQ